MKEREEERKTTDLISPLLKPQKHFPSPNWMEINDWWLLYGIAYRENCFHVCLRSIDLPQRLWMGVTLYINSSMQYFSSILWHLLLLLLLLLHKCYYMQHVLWYTDRQQEFACPECVYVGLVGMSFYQYLCPSCLCVRVKMWADCHLLIWDQLQMFRPNYCLFLIWT